MPLHEAEKTFTEAVVACLLHKAPPELIAQKEALTEHVQRVLGEGNKLPDQPDRAQLEAALHAIRQVLPAEADRIALVAGGATKIKGYVFEAPKLPEIRGASALLDWVNDVALRGLWRDSLSEALGSQDLAEECIIYASGGGFLAFAPAALGEELAAAAERCYTEHTLTANSVFVTGTFNLLELRYGRLSIQDSTLPFWIDEFKAKWGKPELRAVLASYYYGDEAETLEERFYRRKTFGELVTLLATMANQRRDERASHGDTRSVPRYELIPWAEKCESSDVRPVAVTTLVGTDRRALSEASGRKLIAGRIAKGNVYRITDLERDLGWQVPNDLISWGRQMSWERRWEAFLHREGADTFCAQRTLELPGSGQKLDVALKSIRPAKDVHEIGAASSGYMGIIYADGNNVGRLIATLATPKQYAQVSLALSDVARLAVFQALASYIEPITSPPDDNERPFLYPFEILAIGGDDLFVIAPGDKTLDIADSIARYFEAEIEKRLRSIDGLKLPANALSISGHTQRFTGATEFQKQNYIPLIGLSAGVLVAQENAPIFFLRDLVDELLKNAKGLAKDNVKHGFYGGAVDFMVMKSITMVTDKIKSFRRQALGDDGGDSKRRLTARPYTWHEFAGLLQTVREIKNAHVPRSQLYRLRRALDAEPGSAVTPSVMEYLYTRTRLRQEYGDALLNHIEQPWCWETPLTGRATKLPPWMPVGKAGWETMWADMLEAYEMVPDEVQA
ncbi:hypothetical protein SE17_10950 [Kouleothrix aurantiaca]|uniref:Cas10/Cmr2 second palm domain-containing protein n=1 Tax=Kouleothrix aurantiaca TaxID=186479 RepID=A0A0P9D2I4_9CHLR|nr:hypothetical protein SE17_10950 [Kouleothrix aurantiaca]